MISLARRFVAVIGALAVFSPLCTAQEISVPQFYPSFNWYFGIPEVPPPPIGYRADAPRITNMVAVDCMYPLDPALVADQAVDQILERLFPTGGGSPTLEADSICLNMIGLGHHSEFSCHLNGTQWVNQDLRYHPARFFVESSSNGPTDRLPGLDDYLGDVSNSAPVHWPIPRDDLSCPPDPDHQSPYDERAARAYLHPFLVNAGPNSVLKTWCAAFINRYRQRQQADNRIPSPDMIAVDDEISILLPLPVGGASADSVFMLWFLATHATYWSNTPVPGNPHPVTGQPATLAQLYDYERTHHHPSWPTNIADALRPNGVFLAASDPTSPHIRSISLWWADVCARSIDAVWANSLYSVAHATGAWPQTNAYGEYKVKCSNFGVARWDGQDDETSWYKARDYDEEPPATCGPNHDQLCQPTRTPSNRLPRCFIDPQFGQYMFRVPSPMTTGDTHPLQWLSHTGWASGDVDSPFLYWLRDLEFEPVTNWAPETLVCVDPPNPCVYADLEGHKQYNQYLPIQSGYSQHPPESQQQTTERTMRHAVESQHHSYGGGHARRTWPYIEPAYNIVGTYGIGAVTPGDLRRFLSMLRAKNILGGNIWPDGGPSYTLLQHQNVVMQQTADVIYQVYASRITGITVLAGAWSDPFNPPDPALLEYSLRDFGGVHNSTLDLQADNGYSTGLQVEYDGLTPYQSGYSYRINLESWVQRDSLQQNIRGLIFAWDWCHDKWVMVQTTAGEGGVSYGFHTPVRPGTTIVESRCSFRLVPELCYVDEQGHEHGHQYVSNDGHFRLKLIHLNPYPTTVLSFRSSFDLAQVIPEPTVYDGGFQLSGGEGIDVPKSDFDYDQMVTSADLVKFVYAWFAGDLIADMNNDGHVDQTDLELYLAAFANGS